MRFEGTFLNEKGEKVNYWFEAPDKPALMRHLEEKKWRVVRMARIWALGAEIEKVCDALTFRFFTVPCPKCRHNNFSSALQSFYIDIKLDQSYESWLCPKCFLRMRIHEKPRNRILNLSFLSCGIFIVLFIALQPIGQYSAILGFASGFLTQLILIKYTATLEMVDTLEAWQDPNRFKTLDQ